MALMTVGLAGRRSSTGGKVPASTSSVSIGASWKAQAEPASTVVDIAATAKRAIHLLALIDFSLVHAR
jgi:hypothetical protein